MIVAALALILAVLALAATMLAVVAHRAVGPRVEELRDERYAALFLRAAFVFWALVIAACLAAWWPR